MSPYRGLHVLADDDPRWKCDPVEQARAACAGGASVVQLRAKNATDRIALGWARELRRITREAGVLLVLNDRLDLALAAGADALHLGQDDLPPAEVPASARQRLAVGRSTHDSDQVRRALTEDIDYLAFGPIFGTTSKDSEYAARGLSALRRIAELVAPRPLVAIGGIEASNAQSVMRAGATAIAVIGAVAGAPDPEAAVRELVRAISKEGGSAT
jgi:thiamine-phosphate pyrophosphorylase